MDKRMKKKIAILGLAALLLKGNNVLATDQYTVRDYAYFDPVTTTACDETNYWTIYNQDTTCYRFVVLETEDTSSKSTIKLMLDHDLNTTTFDNYQTVLDTAASEWTRYTGTLDIPSEEDIAKVMKLGDNRPTISDDPSTISINGGVFVYTLNTNTMYTINKVTTNHYGYWLKGTYSDDTYAYTVTEYGNNRLVLKTKERGVRPVITINKDLATKQKDAIDITSIVSGANEYKYPFSTETYDGYTYKQMQGFTVTNSKIAFYSSYNNNPEKGLVISYGGNSFGNLNRITYDTTGHGNGMTFNSTTNKVLLVGANSYKDLYEYDGDTLEKTKTYTSSDGYSGNYSGIGYDPYHNYYIAYNNRRIIILNSGFEELYSFDATHLLTSQDLEYYNGYIYYTAFEAGEETIYQLYHFNEPYSGQIYVYNAKLKEDGTPEKDFGRLVSILNIDNINRDNLGGTGEIEGISFKDDTAWLGYAAQHYDSTNTYKFYTFNASSIEPTFLTTDNNVSYKVGDYDTTATITSPAELKEVSGWTLSADKHKLTKKYNNNTTSEANVEVCDYYSNCSTVTIKKMTLRNRNMAFSESAVNKLFSEETYTLAATKLGSGAITYTSSDETIATVDQTGKVTFISPGVVTITATVEKTAQYYKGTASYVLNITRGEQVLNFDTTSVSKTYGDDDFTVEVTHSEGNGAITYSSSDASVATVDSTGKVTINGAGTATITAMASATPDYNQATASYVLNVAKANQVLNYSETSVSKTYGDADFTVGISHPKGNGNIIYGSSNNSIATVDSTGKVTIKGVGSTTITATAEENSNYNAVSASYVLNIVKANQALNFTETSVSKNYGDADFTVGINHTKGNGAITYSSSNTSVATIDNNGKVTIKGVGNTTITATAAATTNYNSASTSYSLNVVANAQAISFANSSITKKITDSSFTIKATRIAGDGAITYSSSNTSIATVDNEGKVTIKGVGNTTITATAAATANYDATSASYILNVTKANQILSFASASVSKSYGDDDFTVRVTHSEGNGAITYSSSDTSVATVDNNGKVTIKGGGTATITATAAATSTYNEASTSYTLNVGANAQVISFEFSSVTKNFNDKAFTIEAIRGEGDGAITYTSSDTSIATVDNNGKVTIKGAGRTIITATAAATANYDATSASYALNIAKGTQHFTEVKNTIEKKFVSGESFPLEISVDKGDGELFYDSSNEEVATISDEGMVTIEGIGVTTLTVTAEETENYLQTVASTELRVTEEGPSSDINPATDLEIAVPNTSKTLSSLKTMISILLITVGVIYIYRKKPIFIQNKKH